MDRKTKAALKTSVLTDFDVVLKTYQTKNKR